LFQTSCRAAHKSDNKRRTGSALGETFVHNSARIASLPDARSQEARPPLNCSCWREESSFVHCQVLKWSRRAKHWASHRNFAVRVAPSASWPIFGAAGAEVLGGSAAAVAASAAGPLLVLVLFLFLLAVLS